MNIKAAARQQALQVLAHNAFQLAQDLTRAVKLAHTDLVVLEAKANDARMTFLDSRQEDTEEVAKAALLRVLDLTRAVKRAHKDLVVLDTKAHGARMNSAAAWRKAVEVNIPPSRYGATKNAAVTTPHG